MINHQLQNKCRLKICLLSRESMWVATFQLMVPLKGHCKTEQKYQFRKIFSKSIVKC